MFCNACHLVFAVHTDLFQWYWRESVDGNSSPVFVYKARLLDKWRLLVWAEQMLICTSEVNTPDQL